MSGGAGRLLAVVALVLLAGCANGVPTSPPDDPLSAVDDPGRRADLLHQLDALPRYEAAGRQLVASAQDPYGWRAAVGKGTPISDAITGIVADHIEAFAAAGPGGVSPIRIDQGFSGGFGLSRQDARDVLTFVGAGRAVDGPDTDLVRIHVAAQQFTRYEVAQAASGALGPATAFATAAGVTVAVHTADFRTALRVLDDADAARQSLFADGSLASALVADEALAAITRAGPAGAGPEWSEAVRDHHRVIATELRALAPDQARPEPRTALESDEVDRLRGRDRIPWGFM
jgi:hypothetical protein